MSLSPPKTNKQKAVIALKILAIVVLVLGISFLAMMQWRGDAIMRRVMTMVQEKMVDSLRYEDVSLEWVRYFPSAALQIKGLQIGTSKAPFIDGGNVAVVLRLFPLLKDRIVINKLIITDSRVHIAKHKGKWTYDLFKNPDAPNKTDAADITSNPESGKWETLIRQLELVNTIVFYDDSDGLSFALQVDKGTIKGDMTGELFDAALEMKAELKDLKMKDYIQSQPFSFDMQGKYKYDAVKGYQELKNWKIENDGIELEAGGHIRKEEDQQWMDVHVSWMDANPQVIKSLLPKQEIKNWNAYVFSGKSEGQLFIKGISSDTESPHIRFSSELKNGSVKFPGEGGLLKNMLLDLAYDNGEAKSKKNSYFRANLRSGSFEGNSLKANMRMENLEQPVIDLDMSGSFPASLLNLFMDSTTWNFKEGAFDVESYKIDGLLVKTLSTKTLVEKSIAELSANHVRFSYNDDEIEINDGDMDLDDGCKMKMDISEFIWNKAKGEKIEGELNFKGDQVDFILNGNHSQGEVHSKGSVTGLGTKPVLNADWKVKGIEMKELLASFENFDQTFVTSDNLKGKADIWSHTMIPYDAKGNIMPRHIVVRAAVDIRDGQLKDMKTLEDFSKYVHLDDLKDIRFNQFRNYLKIEDGKVYLPVMFLQSSAINMSINGVHSFDQEILYNLKINAGQAAVNKLKKFDPFKKFKSARKSGWINLYYVLSGNVDNVKYEQDQKQVISSFEQSTQIKENLRNYLVDRFGHDVYWLEPNEWEDIPEYK